MREVTAHTPRTPLYVALCLSQYLKLSWSTGSGSATTVESGECKDEEGAISLIGAHE
jgi:hypothetical protein